MNIDQHISQLLYHHDCVIVPGLGGFVTNMQPARIHPVQHLFYPPSKSIGFNIHLKRNDGLLANSISHIEALAYDEALKRISDFVNNCNEVLHEGKKFTIEDVGALYLDVEKHLRFEADHSINYLADSFGLTVIQSPPVKRETITEKVEKKIKYREPLKPEATTVKRKTYWKTAVKAALTLPVVGLFAWATIQTFNVYKQNTDTGNLSPFKTEVKTENNSLKEESLPEQVNIPLTEDIEQREEIINDESVYSVRIHKTTPGELIYAEKIKEAEVKVIEEIQPPITISNENDETFLQKRYFIIAGAFAIPENAEKLISQLKQKGFNNASVIDTTKHGLHVVSYNEGHEKYSDALHQLTNLKSSENPAAWLFKKQK